MKLHLFALPASGGSEELAALNRLLASSRVAELRQEFVQAGLNSYWAVSVTTLQEQVQRTQPVKKVDYKEVLSPEEFELFASLRECRRVLAEELGIPVYSIFTNEQLAAMTREKPNSRSALRSIPGVGEARAEKYGDPFLHKIHSDKVEDATT